MKDKTINPKDPSTTRIAIASSCCGGYHQTIAGALLKSKHWKAWKKRSEKNMLFDVNETEELDMMSDKHFEAFISFTFDYIAAKTLNQLNHMKTKKEILKMDKKQLLSELEKLRESTKLDVSCTFCDDDSLCHDCNYCNDCYDCYYSNYCTYSTYCNYCNYCNYCDSCRACNYCSFCYGLTNAKYMICNVQFTKEEYEKKMNELNL